jgi:hypothetical protein
VLTHRLPDRPSLRPVVFGALVAVLMVVAPVVDGREDDELTQLMCRGFSGSARHRSTVGVSSLVATLAAAANFRIGEDHVIPPSRSIPQGRNLAACRAEI